MHDGRPSRPSRGDIQLIACIALAPIGDNAHLRSLTYDELVAARRRGLVPIRHSLLLDRMVALVEAGLDSVASLAPAYGRRTPTRSELVAIWKRRAILVEPARR